MCPENIPSLRKASVPRQSRSDALVTSLAALVDRSLMRTVSFVVEKRVLPRDVDLDMLRDSIEAMFRSGLVEEPRALFDFVDALEDASCPAGDVYSHGHRRIRGGKAYRCSLDSAYRQHPATAPAGDVGGVDSIRFEHWVHDDTPSQGTVIVLHGFAMGWPVIDAVALSAGKWFERGLDVVLLTLPDHGPRRPEGAVFSGQSFTVPHALRLAGAVHRAVHEIFEVKAWLRAVNDLPVGLAGMSLGGYLASLCAGLSADFDFLVPIVPPACMGDLAWRVYRDTGYHRAGLDATLTEENMRAAFFAHSPLAYPLQTPRDSILIVAGAGDRIVPPEHPSALWEHWGRPRIHWLRGSHMAPVASVELMDVAARHLKRLGIL